MDPSLASWCECFPGILIPEPLPTNPHNHASVDVLTASPPQPDDAYRVWRVVGTGATGTAFVGCRARDGLPIIAKVVELGDLDERERARTTSEIDCLARCKHSMIIQYLAHYLVDTRLLLVMELADAGDLAFQIKRRKTTNSPFQEQEVALMMVQVLIAVNYIHQQSVLHRDLKPANVFVKTNGLVKIGDFGLSRIFDGTVSQNVAQSVVGTPYYLAPEVWKHERYSNKVDMFSIGVLWYEMLTLERPFKGSNLTVVRESILNGEFPELPAHLSHDTRAIVHALLSPNPQDRPSIVQVFETSLMDHALRIFTTSIVFNLPTTEVARQYVQQDALAVRAKVAAHIDAKFPVAQPPSLPRMKELAFATALVHMDCGKWKYRALRLTDCGALDIAKSMSSFGASALVNVSGDGSSKASCSTSTMLVPELQPGVLRSLALTDIMYINDVPACFAEGRINVFSIVLRGSDEALWFYSAVDPNINDEWRQRISEICGRCIAPSVRSAAITNPKCRSKQ